MTQQTFVAESKSMLAAAREIIAGQTYCALVTLNAGGQPQVRTMNPFPPEEDLAVWMATNSRSRKVQEIRNNPQVCLYYANHQEATGTVVIHGEAVLVDDMEEKLKRKRAYWDQSFPDWKYLLLIKVIAKEVEVLNYKCGYLNDPITWKIPSLDMEKSAVKSNN
jgi:general stress protein 26